MSKTNIAIKPLGRRVMVQPDDAPTQTEGGILLPEQSKETPQLGTVRALGTGGPRKAGGPDQPFIVKVGDRVIVSKYGGTKIDVGGLEFKLFDEDEILATFQEKKG